MDTQENDVQEQRQKLQKNIQREILEWALALGAAVLLALFLTQVVFINAQIPSSSMEKTIMTGDRILGYRWSYSNSSPQRGDIVMFYFPDNEEEIYVKRVIGLPGEKVQIVSGLVYINDAEVPLDEPYVNGLPSGDFGPYYVPEDSYFMLGDNRMYSLDSRKWKNTFVKEDKIIGKAVFRLFPNTGTIG